MTHNSRGRIDFIYRITIKCFIYFFYIKIDLIFPCVKSGKKCKPLFVCVVCVMEFLLRFNQHRQYYVVSRCRLDGYYWERFWINWHFVALRCSDTKCCIHGNSDVKIDRRATLLEVTKILWNSTKRVNSEIHFVSRIILLSRSCETYYAMVCLLLQFCETGKSVGISNCLLWYAWEILM